MVKNITKSFLISAAVIALSATPAFAGYGSSPGGQSNNAPNCGNSVPGKPQVVFVRKSGSSQIEIGWNSVDSASTWTIAYGNQSGKYTYGMSNFGDNGSRSVKINMLPPGTYYAVVKANNGCMPGPFSNERKITVFNSGAVLGAKTTKPSNVLGVTSLGSPTPAPTAAGNPTPTGTSSNGGSDNKLNFFQKIWQMIFGK